MKNIGHLYAASCKKDGGIFDYAMDETHELHLIRKMQVDRPMYMAIDGHVLYVVAREARDGYSQVIRFYINHGEGRVQSTHGICSCYITAKNGKVYTANYLSGDITLMPDKLVKHSGHGVNALRQEAPHPHQAEFTPDGKYIAAVDLGIDEIVTYDLEMNEICRSKAPLGSGPRHIAYNPEGTLAYCVEELSNNVSIYEYKDGCFTYLSTVSCLPSDWKGANKAAAIRVADGNVYVSHRGYDHITVFKICGKGLEKIEDIDCCGKSPRDFIVVGQSLIIANEESDSIVVLSKEKDQWLKSQELFVERPICVVIE